MADPREACPFTRPRSIRERWPTEAHWVFALERGIFESDVDILECDTMFRSKRGIVGFASMKSMGKCGGKTSELWLKYSHSGQLVFTRIDEGMAL